MKKPTIRIEESNGLKFYYGKDICVLCGHKLRTEQEKPDEACQKCELESLRPDV
jgi:hypothetical protein